MSLNENNLDNVKTSKSKNLWSEGGGGKGVGGLAVLLSAKPPNPESSPAPSFLFNLHAQSKENSRLDYFFLIRPPHMYNSVPC